MSSTSAGRSPIVASRGVMSLAGVYPRPMRVFFGRGSRETSPLVLRSAQRTAGNLSRQARGLAPFEKDRAEALGPVAGGIESASGHQIVELRRLLLPRPG